MSIGAARARSAGRADPRGTLTTKPSTARTRPATDAPTPKPSAGAGEALGATDETTPPTNFRKAPLSRARVRHGVDVLGDRLPGLDAVFTAAQRASLEAERRRASRAGLRSRGARFPDCRARARASWGRSDPMRLEADALRPRRPRRSHEGQQRSSRAWRRGFDTRSSRVALAPAGIAREPVPVIAQRARRAGNGGPAIVRNLPLRVRASRVVSSNRNTRTQQTP